MGEKILSPGVFQNESDQSLVQRGIQGTATAIVGPTVLGQPLVPTYVTSYSDYTSKFGESFKSGSYYYEYLTSLAAKDFFFNGGQTLLVTRVISGSSNVSTYAESGVPNSLTSTAGARSSASFVLNTNDTSSFSSNGAPFMQLGIPNENNYYIGLVTNTGWLSAGSVYQDSVSDIFYIGVGASPTMDQIGNYITASVNVSASFFRNKFTASFDTATDTLTFTAVTTANQNSVPNNNWFVSRSFINAGVPSANSTGQSFANGADGTVNNSFTLETLAWGDQMNNTSSITAGALASGTAANVRWEITSVNTGSGTFNLAIRAGNDNNAQLNYLETFPNLSLDPALPNFITRVIGDSNPVYKVDGAGVPYIDYTGSYANASQYVRVKSVDYPQVDSIDNNGNYKSGSYSGSLPLVGSGSYGGSFAGGVAATNRVQLMNENITTTNIQGFSPADYTNAFGILTNKDEYQFNVLLAPGIGLDNSAAARMISTCEDRGDAVAMVDCKTYGSTVVGATQAAAGQSSNYAATYWPWIQLQSTALGKAVWAPATTVMGGVLAFNDRVGAEWFAPAGLNRGGLPNVLKAERKLSQTDRDVLYEGNVNPLATFPGNGVVVFGQKTLQRKATALDRVNVRRLLIRLKDFIGQVANNLVFEQNTTITRNRFLSQVNPYLDSVVQQQGLFAYKVVMDDSNNTPDVIDRNQLVGQIYIQPTKTAEFIILNFNVLPTGATFPA
jgi:hypothetical protein